MCIKGYSSTGFEERVYHLHVRYSGDWKELYFRDYLIDMPEVAKAYGHLKLELAQKYKNNRDTYTEAKTEFINKITVLGKERYQDYYNLIQ